MSPSGPEKIPAEEFHQRLKAQGVSNRIHAATVCPMCGTVQSIASLIRAGLNSSRAEGAIGFACEGRITVAGPWPAPSNTTAKAHKRRAVRGCDWTLGGLFRIHRLEVTTDDGKVHPAFEAATPEQAQALEKHLAETAPTTAQETPTA